MKQAQERMTGDMPMQQQQQQQQQKQESQPKKRKLQLMAEELQKLREEKRASFVGKQQQQPPQNDDQDEDDYGLWSELQGDRRTEPEREQKNWIRSRNEENGNGLHKKEMDESTASTSSTIKTSSTSIEIMMPTRRRNSSVGLRRTRCRHRRFFSLRHRNLSSVWSRR